MMMTIAQYLAYPVHGDGDLGADAAAHIRKGEARTLKAGGSWIYDNEIDSVTGSFEDGDIISVLDHDGFFLGLGFINRASKIRIRMLSRGGRQSDGSFSVKKITPQFLYDRVRAAWEYRKHVIDTSSCRVIFGEADHLPGLTVDKYEDVLVVESLALGTERLKDVILASLVQVLDEDGIRIRGIYERSDAPVREKEGLSPLTGFLSEPFDTNVLITENGVRFLVDVANGQKTGFFLDQKENRRAIRRICQGAKVLDCFTHTGSFALNAAAAGAAEVLAVDASELAVQRARENAELNGFSDRVRVECADVFSFLPDKEREGELYDVVILDPPAFTKSRETIKSAARGYREINRRGMALVRDGGFLVTASCSHFMDEEHFRKVIDAAAHDAHRRLTQVEFRTQAPDHPILWGSGTSYYLKFFIFRVDVEK